MTILIVMVSACYNSWKGGFISHICWALWHLNIKCYYFFKNYLLVLASRNCKTNKYPKYWKHYHQWHYPVTGLSRWS